MRMTDAKKEWMEWKSHRMCVCVGEGGEEVFEKTIIINLIIS